MSHSNIFDVLMDLDIDEKSTSPVHQSKNKKKLTKLSNSNEEILSAPKETTSADLQSPGSKDPQVYNPELIIESLEFNQKMHYIIRDDYLVGGTKQRGMVPLLQHSKKREFVYAGPTNGYAQIALAYAAKLTNKKATLIVNKDKYIHPFTKKAQELGAKVIPIREGFLAKIQAKAIAYVRRTPTAELIPFGGGSKEFIQYMTENIQAALPAKLKENPPKRIWLVGGSATLLNVLYKVFPTTYFNVVQIGKRIWDDQLQLNRTTKYVAPEKFYESAYIPPPYPSVMTYDAKLWGFVCQYGKDGDYLWNVAAD